MMDRIPTGIKGFDELIQGGFPKGSAILLSGSPGTGKSIFAMEYIYRGALDHGDVGMYVSFEQSPQDLREQAKQVGFSEIERLEQEGKIILTCIPVNEIEQGSVSLILRTAKEAGLKRFVVDSLSALSINAPIYSMAKDMVISDVMGGNTVLSPPIIGDDLKKNFIYKFIGQVKNIPATALLLSEIPEKGSSLSSDTVSEFAADGIILITFESLGGEFSRSLLIRKMRMTRNNEDIHPLEISPGGLIVHSVD